MQLMQYMAGVFLPLVLTLLLILLLRPVAISIGLSDSPSKRKKHQGVIPLVGGIGIFCAFLFSVLALDVPAHNGKSLFAAAALLLIIGIMDDLNEVQVRDRFIAQIGGVVLVVLWGGVGLHALGDLVGFGMIYLGAIAIPFTIFSAVGVMNALNMIDGIDGLSSGIILILLTIVAVLLWENGYEAELQLALILIGGVLAFFVLNFVLRTGGRAFCFLGDSGSLFLGIVVATWLIQYSQAPYNLYRPVTALWLFAIPLLDTVSIMTRRMLEGGSPFKPDRRHLHHALLRYGFSARFTTLLLLIAQCFFVTLGMLGEYLDVAESKMFYGFLALFAGHMMLMRYVERHPEAWRHAKESIVNNDTAS